MSYKEKASPNPRRGEFGAEQAVSQSKSVAVTERVKSTQPVDVSDIGQAFQTLYDQINMLDDLTRALPDRFAAVLQVVPESEAKVGHPSLGNSSTGIGGQVLTIAESIRTVNHRLSDVIARCGL
jgi:hypothetical protein